MNDIVLFLRNINNGFLFNVGRDSNIATELFYLLVHNGYDVAEESVKVIRRKKREGYHLILVEVNNVMFYINEYYGQDFNRYCSSHIAY